MQLLFFESDKQTAAVVLQAFRWLWQIGDVNKREIQCIHHAQEKNERELSAAHLGFELMRSFSAEVFSPHGLRQFGIGHSTSVLQASHHLRRIQMPGSFNFFPSGGWRRGQLLGHSSESIGETAWPALIRIRIKSQFRRWFVVLPAPCRNLLEIDGVLVTVTG